ncbi:MAG: WYL domain-containing transcriptional regulator [Clostridiales bacterium]|nr:WYL domain-containing transcriptional regulator [Clostridiales bacterium]
MPKSANQKMKLLYLADMLRRESDEENPLTVKDITARLEAAGIPVERKTVYDDISTLEQYGMDIIKERRGRETVYWLGARAFELSEVKLLVDSVQASRFITEKKSRELITKLEGLTSRAQAKQLRRQVVLTGRVKADNESIYYGVDAIHQAINGDRQVRFRYFSWDRNGRRHARRNGEWYVVSPWALMWMDENYYLVTYAAATDDIRHYRVDKMTAIEVLDEPRLGGQRFKEFDMARYARGLFGMFGGEMVRVTIEARNDMANVLIDRFGRDIWIDPIDKERFSAKVEVAMSDQFLCWIIALGEDVRLVGPQSAVARMQEIMRRLQRQYEE